MYKNELVYSVININKSIQYHVNIKTNFASVTETRLREIKYATLIGDSMYQFRLSVVHVYWGVEYRQIYLV